MKATHRHRYFGVSAPHPILFHPWTRPDAGKPAPDGELECSACPSPWDHTLPERRPGQAYLHLGTLAARTLQCTHHTHTHFLQSEVLTTHPTHAWHHSGDPDVLALMRTVAPPGALEPGETTNARVGRRSLLYTSDAADDTP